MTYSSKYLKYPRSHVQRRKELLPKAIGTLCPVCHKIMTADQKLHLDHSVPIRNDPTPRPGDRIIHAGCNTGWQRGLKGNGQPKGSTKDRGYGAAHQKLRKEWAKTVEAGEVHCSHCARRIDQPGTGATSLALLSRELRSVLAEILDPDCQSHAADLIKSIFSEQ
jgi:hypothetical protein